MDQRWLAQRTVMVENAKNKSLLKKGSFQYIVGHWQVTDSCCILYTGKGGLATNPNPEWYSLGPVLQCGSTTALYTAAGSKGKKEALLFQVRSRSQAEPRSFWMLLDNLRTDDGGSVLNKLIRDNRHRNAKTLAGNLLYDTYTRTSLVPLQSAQSHQGTRHTRIYFSLQRP